MAANDPRSHRRTRGIGLGAVRAKKQQPGETTLKGGCGNNPTSALAFENAEANLHYALGIIGGAHFEQDHGRLAADIDGDGALENFRTCVAPDATHLSVWSGTLRRWLGKRGFPVAYIGKKFACNEQE